MNMWSHFASEDFVCSDVTVTKQMYNIAVGSSDLRRQNGGNGVS